MKVLAIVSRFAAHIDFGGNGYLSVVDMLRNQGHDVTWVSVPDRLKSLSALGYKVLSLPPVQFLTRFSGVPEDARKASVAALTLVMQELRPDLVLCDRVLDAVPDALAGMDIPLVVVGSPGGAWHATRIRGMPTVAPVVDSANLSDGQELWITEADRFLVFMPRCFYHTGDRERTLCIRHGDMLKAADRRRFDTGRVSVLMGNCVQMQSLLDAISMIPKGIAIDVFHSPDRKLLGTNEFRSLAERAGVDLRGWQDLSIAIRPSAYTIGLGGIGSIWRSIACDLPMLACPEGRGDQAWNAGRLEASGLGKVWFGREGGEGGIHDTMIGLSEQSPPSSRISASDFDTDMPGLLRELETLV